MLSNLKKHGDIQMVVGPMFSGKSTEVIRRVRKYRAAKREVLVVKYAADTRYSAECLATHDRSNMEAVSTSTLEQINYLVTDNISVIAVDEGQFYSDIVKYAELWANSGKTVIISALDGTWQRKPFACISELMSLADSVEKLTAVCYKCQETAPFSARITQETEEVVIGGADKYVACCRKCWMELQK
ncbi:Thymidine_kinase [Hexamita inflata]|uniref:Thymidine kinase n=1 Tax=Hexamita inflata TaxID=28002 RepID=A0AA86U5W3_9EUKA|nr:Thymidine kinase [Hexamita inflata]